MCSQHFDEMWMRYAVMLASYAECYGEVSVGAVLIKNGQILGEGWNASITLHDPTAHAEIMALRQGGRVVGNYRLLGTTLYVTLEPCIMCFGAIVHARVCRLVFGAEDKKNGVIVSQGHYLDNYHINHNVNYTSGVLKELCSSQILNFFYRKRLENHICKK